MEVAERTLYDKTVLNDSVVECRKSIDSGLVRFDKINSRHYPFHTIKQDCDYVAKEVSKECISNNNDETSTEETIGSVVGKVIGSLVQSSENTSSFTCSLLDNTNVVKQIVESEITFESRQIVNEILEQIDSLSNIERLYLFLKIPKANVVSDPLKQPLNPLGNRLEISRTIAWIKAHYEEDSTVSIPKQIVYSEYMDYCDSNEIKPLSNADFGKVMKQVFTHVRPRRLGTRGNSRYCYAGMQKKQNLSTPTLPEITPQNILAKSKEAAAITPDTLTTVTRERSPEVAKRKRVKTTVSNKEIFVKEEKTEVSTSLENFNMAVTDERTNDHRNKMICDNYCDPENLQEDTVLSTGSEDLIKPECKSTNIIDSLCVASSENQKLNHSVVNVDKIRTSTSKLINNNDYLPIKEFTCTDMEETFSTLNNVEKVNKLPIPRLSKNPHCKQIVPTDIIILPAVKSHVIRKQYKRIKPKPEGNDLFRKLDLEGDGNLKTVTSKGEKLLSFGFRSKPVSHININCLETDTSSDHPVHASSDDNNNNNNEEQDETNSQEPEEELLKYFHSKGRSSNSSTVTSQKVSQLRFILESNSRNINSNESKCGMTKLFSSVGGLKGATTILTVGQNIGLVENRNITGVLSVSQGKPLQINPDSSSQSELDLNSGLNIRGNSCFENPLNLVSGSLKSHHHAYTSFTPISPTDKLETISVGGIPFVSPRNTTVPRIKFLNQQHSCVSQLSPDIISNPKCQNPARPSSVQSNIFSSSPAPNFRSRSFSSSRLSDKTMKMSPFQDCIKPQMVSLNSPACYSFTGNMYFPSTSAVANDSLSLSDKINIPIQQFDDDFLSKPEIPGDIEGSSLLESILLNGKESSYFTAYNKNRNNIKTDNLLSPNSCNNSSRVRSADPLSQEISQFFPEEECQLPEDFSVDFQPTLRSRSVPVASSNALVSPLSVIQPASYFNNNMNVGVSIPSTPVPSEPMDFGSNLNTESSSSNFILDTPDNANDHNKILRLSENPENESSCSNVSGNKNNSSVSLDNDIISNWKTLLDLMGDEYKPLINNIDSNNKSVQQISRSYPNTPVPLSLTSSDSDKYCNSLMSSLIPDATAVGTSNNLISRSYPSTPAVLVPGLSEVIAELSSHDVINDPDASTDLGDRSIDGLKGSRSLFIDNDDDLTLQSFATADLHECGENFADMEKDSVFDSIDEVGDTYT